MAKRMQYCCWCGEKLGVYDSSDSQLEHCHQIECARQASRLAREIEADARERAERDDYGRYR